MGFRAVRGIVIHFQYTSKIPRIQAELHRRNVQIYAPILDIMLVYVPTPPAAAGESSPILTAVL